MSSRNPHDRAICPQEDGGPKEENKKQTERYTRDQPRAWSSFLLPFLLMSFPCAPSLDSCDLIVMLCWVDNNIKLTCCSSVPPSFPLDTLSK